MPKALHTPVSPRTPPGRGPDTSGSPDPCRSLHGPRNPVNPPCPGTPQPLTIRVPCITLPAPDPCTPTLPVSPLHHPAGKSPCITLPVSPLHDPAGKSPASPCRGVFSVLQAPRWLVLDLSLVSFVDSTGANLLTQLHRDLQPAGVTLCLAAASDRVLGVLEACGVLDHIPRNLAFHSTHDAVTAMTCPGPCVPPPPFRDP
ncbi:hypothetical protein GWK47_001428 [Chionoecetes opilio]|uniref:STAS domain-containing protein n=1 Tax=Chionoecetes opilio TaxID=41210 RepID=A0A8J4Y0T6_CHIOP|nr:hypothetical protein GWK47_001428 [Chionoecetes opilio]